MAPPSIPFLGQFIQSLYDWRSLLDFFLLFLNIFISFGSETEKKKRLNYKNPEKVQAAHNEINKVDGRSVEFEWPS